MVKVKICGITREDDARKAAGFGAWAVGFVFYKKSPRYVGPFRAKKIIDLLPPFVTPVGIFVDQKEGAIKDIAAFCGLRTLQFHGNESPEFCRRFTAKGYKIIKAFRVSEGFDPDAVTDYQVDAFLFDAFDKDQPGGTGKTFDWSRIKNLKSLGKPVILSGGLNSQNVKKAIEEIRPYAVDVSSGVEEAPGKKSERLMREFLNQILIGL